MTCSPPPTTREPSTTPTSSHHQQQEEEEDVAFYKLFFSSPGTVSILLLSTLIAVSLGSVVGIIPDVVADRYARIRYDYTGAECASFDRWDKPTACQQGADDAQAAAATSTLALNLLTLVFNPVVGSLSDVQGRRGMMVLALGLYCFGATVFCLLQWQPQWNPSVYYASVSLSGAVDFLSLTFAAASDVLPQSMRAAGYGILLAGYYGGFSLAPSIPLVASHFHTSLVSCAASWTALLLAILWLPETLPGDIAMENRQLQFQQQQESIQQERGTLGSSYSSDDDNPIFSMLPPPQPQPHWTQTLVRTISRPIRDMSILTRGSLPILAAASFFSAMVYSSDKTFVIYYIEDQLNVRDADIAKMFLIFGPVGVILQAFFLQPLLHIIGEKQLLLLAFFSGTCHNALYGLAKTKTTILFALCLSQFTKLNFPILSSYASRGASDKEQGRVQGALFALNALANAVGPMLLEIVYNATKNNDGQQHHHHFLGPGTMFLCASLLYAVGGMLVTLLPRVDETTTEQTTTITLETPYGMEIETDNTTLEEPLLSGGEEG